MEKTIRQRVEQLFGLPAMKMPWSLYMAQLNESGKLTARSIMDILTVVLEAVEGMEEDIKDAKLIAESVEFDSTPILTPDKVSLEPKTTSEKVSEVTAEIITKNAPEDILGDKPPEPKSSE